MSALPLRDRAALAELGAQRFLSRRQLEELLLAETALGPGSRATVVKRILRRLRERGLVQVSPRLFEGLDGIRGETAYSLTPVGRRVLGSGLAELKNEDTALLELTPPVRLLTLERGRRGYEVRHGGMQTHLIYRGQGLGGIHRGRRVVISPKCRNRLTTFGTESAGIRIRQAAT